MTIYTKLTGPHFITSSMIDMQTIMLIGNSDNGIHGTNQSPAYHVTAIGRCDWSKRHRRFWASWRRQLPVNVSVCYFCHLFDIYRIVFASIQATGD